MCVGVDCTRMYSKPIVFSCYDLSDVITFFFLSCPCCFWLLLRVFMLSGISQTAVTHSQTYSWADSVARTTVDGITINLMWNKCVCSVFFYRSIGGFFYLAGLLSFNRSIEDICSFFSFVSFIGILLYTIHIFILLCVQHLTQSIMLL